MGEVVGDYWERRARGVHLLSACYIIEEEL